ncbi:MAG: Uma2 family endonuclease, partial [Gemmataceae bacterium]|nr:Uma2 family endonuclease [Gemmataceae bacterium]
MSSSTTRRASRKPRKKNEAPVSAEVPFDIPIPDVEHIVTEDDSPVDNLYSSKQQKLLTETLTSSWDGGGKPFIAAANIGLFNMAAPAFVVPDVVLAMGVKPLGPPKHKCNRAYFFWMIGKPPDVAIEIVSNSEGGELGEKLEKYAFLRVPYYLVWDPSDYLKCNRLRVHVLQEMRYVPTDDTFLPGIGLGLKIWKGRFDDWDDIEWLRWCDRDGALLKTGA